MTTINLNECKSSTAETAIQNFANYIGSLLGSSESVYGTLVNLALGKLQFVYTNGKKEQIIIDQAYFKNVSGSILKIKRDSILAAGVIFQGELARILGEHASISAKATLVDVPHNAQEFAKNFKALQLFYSATWKERENDSDRNNQNVLELKSYLNTIANHIEQRVHAKFPQIADEKSAKSKKSSITQVASTADAGVEEPEVFTSVKEKRKDPCKIM